MAQEVSELVQSALDGYNVCLFSYGQTGSGKTHTVNLWPPTTHWLATTIPSHTYVLDDALCRCKAGLVQTARASSLEQCERLLRYRWRGNSIRAHLPLLIVVASACAPSSQVANGLERNGWKYTLKASFLEIYNEALRDLLR